jgi:hypothetical protein
MLQPDRTASVCILSRRNLAKAEAPRRVAFSGRRIAHQRLGVRQSSGAFPPGIGWQSLNDSCTDDNSANDGSS